MGSDADRGDARAPEGPGSQGQVGVAVGIGDWVKAELQGNSRLRCPVLTRRREARRHPGSLVFAGALPAPHSWSPVGGQV